ncbi:ATP-binding protein [Amycolatopsis halotolerans]|uniref:ATP-binding protein n=3 Tax=Amycolatopsis halotolerans TaxID=330083 RepID=A0ABV7QN92_9PSEU
MAGRFGVLLRQLRQAARLTQERLAERSGVSVRSIRRFELGQGGEPRMATARLLADALCPSPAERHELLAAALTGAESGGQGPVGSTPRQLPAQAGTFVGRRAELASVDKVFGALGSGGLAVVSAIGGGGVGKTWLALRWAYANVPRFPDGQLFVDLRGFTPHGDPMTAQEAVRVLLGSFDLEPAAIPPDLASQTALYRSLTAGKRMVIVLDNARDTAQVAPLLPGGSSCAVLVTSRDRLTGLVAAHGAKPVPLDVLGPADARQLLASRLGHERLAAEPDAAAELLSCCAGLPLALAVVSARAAVRPSFPLEALAAELRHASDRLDTLDADDTAASVRASLSWTHGALTADQATVFALLGLAPGPDIGLPAAAGLAGLPEDETAEVLRALEQVSLVHHHLPGRYRMHDLVKLHAEAIARRDLPERTRDAALRRLVEHYLHSAGGSGQLLDPHRQPVRLAPPAPGCRPRPPADRAATIRWFDAEHPNLLAAQRLAAENGWHREVWQLAWALSPSLHRRGHNYDSLAVWSAAAASADRFADPVAQSLARRFLGWTCALLDRPDDALDHLRHAVALAGASGDPLSQGHALRFLAAVCDQHGDHRQALAHERAALVFFDALEMPAWQGDVLNMMGWSAALLGELDEARAHCEAALALLRRHHHPVSESNTLDSLGYIAHRRGDHAMAVDYYRQALALCRDHGHAFFEAEALEGLGHPYLALGNGEQARAVWRQALALYQTQHRTDRADRVHRQLAALDDDSAPH